MSLARLVTSAARSFLLDSIAAENSARRSLSFSVKLVCEWNRAGAVEYLETADRRRLELASILLSLSLSSRSARNP